MRPRPCVRPRERADHGGSRYKQHNPAVVERVFTAVAWRRGRCAMDLSGIAMSFSRESRVQPLDEFVLDEELVDVFLRAQDHREADAGIAERVEPHDGFEARDAALHGTHHVARHFHGDGFYAIEVALVVDAGLERHDQLVLGGVVVRDNRLRKLRVGHEHGVVRQLPQPAHAPVDVDQVPFFAR